MQKKMYYVRTKEGAFRQVAGVPVMIEGFEAFEFIMHESLDGDYLSTVSEVSSGCIIAKGDSYLEAHRNAYDSCPVDVFLANPPLLGRNILSMKQ